MAEENKSQPRGITKIGVDGFKSLRKAEIEIRPLTILAGANSSGKSAIMQPLLLMKQTLEAQYDPGPLKLDGPNVVFTGPSQFLTRAASELDQGCSITLELDSTHNLSQYFEGHFVGVRNPQATFIKLVETAYTTRDSEIVLYPEMTEEEILSQFSNRANLIDLRTALNNLSKNNFRWRTARNRCFLSLELIAQDEVNEEDRVDFGNAGIVGFPIASFRENLTDVIHVPGFRGTPDRVYPATQVTKGKFPGRFENYFAGIIAKWMHPSQQLVNRSNIQDYLVKLGVSNILGVLELSAVEVDLRIGRTLQSDHDDMVSIADVGFGVSQVLPVLVALLVAEPGQLIYIEQPELHLHPRAQHKLAEFIVEAANRGVRVVIETHSDILLLGVQTLVAKGEFSPDNVILHWFQRGNDGLTKITSRELDEDGAYGDWPEDFADVDMDAQSEYLDTVAEKHLGMTQDAEAIGD